MGLEICDRRRGATLVPKAVAEWPEYPFTELIVMLRRAKLFLTDSRADFPAVLFTFLVSNGSMKVGSSLLYFLL